MWLLRQATVLMACCSLAQRGHAATLWLHAGQARSVSGPMALGSTLAVEERGFFGDLIVPAAPSSPQRISGGYAEFTVAIPEAGTYCVWARMRYPSGRDESFVFIPDGEEPTGALGKHIGNSGVGVSQWHWDSDGAGGRAARPGARRRKVTLEAGPFTFRVYAREAGSNAMANPRLNVVCLTTDAAYVPTDDDAARGLAQVRQFES